MPRCALVVRKADSQICERFSRIRPRLVAGAAAAFLAVAFSIGASAAPEDDYRRGEQALRGGDIVAAMAALRRGADAGHTPSQVLLGNILDQAEFDDEALAWYRKAAEKGDPAGEYGVGTMYLAGEGVKKDLEQAYFWFLRSADKKHAPAIIALASASIGAEQGTIPIAPDKSRSAEWLRRAAALDYLPAVEALAKAYRVGGFGVAPDAAQADQYAAMAAALKKKGAPEKGKKKR